MHTMYDVNDNVPPFFFFLGGGTLPFRSAGMHPTYERATCRRRSPDEGDQ